MKDRLPVKSGVELAPLVDVVFLLLAYLLINSTLARLPAIEVNLPASRAAATSERPAVDIFIDARGQVALNGKQVALADLGRSVSEVLGPESETGAGAGDEANARRIAIRADRAAAYHRVIAVLDALNTAGHTRFQLMTLRGTEPAVRE